MSQMEKISDTQDWAAGEQREEGEDLKPAKSLLKGQGAWGQSGQSPPRSF